MLEPAAAGPRLVFDHSSDGPGPDHFVRLLANRHLTLDLFEHSLAGMSQA